MSSGISHRVKLGLAGPSLFLFPGDRERERTSRAPAPALRGERESERRRGEEPLTPAGCRRAYSVQPMKKEFNVVVERDRDGYYVASIPELKGCHTQAKSLDDLMERIREAAELCLTVQGQDIENLEFIGVQRLTIA